MAGVLVAAIVLLAATAARPGVADVVFKRRMVVVRDSRTGGGLPPPPPIAPVRPVSIKPTFAATGTDKLSRHGYHRFYDQFLQPLYGKAVRMVEVGVLGGDSLRSWQTLETGAVKVQLDPNVHVLYRDQSNCAYLDEIAATAGAEPLDLVIDDGSHESGHMLKTLVKLFPRLAPGGFSVMEDVETSYWDKPGASIYGYALRDVGIGRPGSIMSPLRLLVEVINQRYAHPDYDRAFHFISAGVDPDVAWIMFAQNMVFIRKKTEEDRPYEVPFDTYADGSTWDAFWARPDVVAVGDKVQEWKCAEIV